MSGSRERMSGMHPSIAIVGPGAIGTTVAAALHEVGHTPKIFGRTAREKLELLVEDSRIVVPGPVQIDPAHAGGPVDLLLLAVKSTQVGAAAPWLRVLCTAETVVCVLQNGVEQRSIVGPYVPESLIVPSVVWFPAETRPDGSVRLRGEPRLTLPDVPGSEVILEALLGTRCSVDTTSDFSSVSWRKLLQNAVAGLMVLTGRRAGMFAREDIAALSLAYLEEGLQVARADGATLADDVPQQIIETFRSYPADLGTSILADRDADRPLEWDIRNGVIQRRGRLHGIATPISDLVVPLLAASSDGPG